jgi:penicillin-binding protein 2
MDAGVFDPNWVVHCTGYFDIGNVHMDLKDEHGDVTYLEALTHSYNTYFMTLGLKVGRDILIDTARSLNLGSLTNINLPGELPGCIPDPEYVKRIAGRDFGGGDVANTSIGQGFVLVTPVQMASLMAAIANNGTVYRPRLIQQVEDRTGNVVKSFPVETLRTVTFNQQFMPDMKAAMINVIDHGTATVVHRDDMQIAAKTGTAQVGSKDHRRQIAWLCGFLPADNPQYAFAVMVEGTFEDNRNDTLEGGLLGGVDAGGIAKGIFDQIYPLPGKKGEPTASTKAKPAADDSASTDDAPAPAEKPEAAPHAETASAHPAAAPSTTP